jgi:release factor glutamine methyltransferase
MAAVTALIDSATKLLEQAGVSSPQVDAQLLLAHTIGVECSQLLTAGSLTSQQKLDFEALVTRRANREPLQHLTGVAHFRHISLAVGPGVFVPRPETELLVEAAIAHLKTIPQPRLAADLCAGSGAIALSLAIEVPGTTVHAVELSDDAVKWLTRNVIEHSAQLEAAGSQVIVHHGNAGNRDLLAEFAGKFAAVVSNPPYIPNAMIPRDPEARDHDPAIALFSGDDGLTAARDIVLVAGEALTAGGFFGMEHADVQGESVPSLLNDMTGIWSQVKDNQDYNKLPRFTTALRSANSDVGR